MKILITLLLALFISSQAYAQSATEVVIDGKLFLEKEEKGYSIYLYKKKFYACAFDAHKISCRILQDDGLID